MRDDEEPRNTPVDPTLFRAGWHRVGTTERWQGPDGAELEIQVSLEGDPLDSPRMLIDTVGESLMSDERTPTSPGGSLLPIEAPATGHSLRGTALGLAVAVASLTLTLALVWGGGASDPDPLPGHPRPDLPTVSASDENGGALQGAHRTGDPSSEPPSEGVVAVEDVPDIDAELPGEPAKGVGSSTPSSGHWSSPSQPVVGNASAAADEAPSSQVIPAVAGATEAAAPERETWLGARLRSDRTLDGTRLVVGVPDTVRRPGPSSSAAVPRPGSGASATASENTHRRVLSDTHVLLDQQSPY